MAADRLQQAYALLWGDALSPMEDDGDAWLSSSTRRRLIAVLLCYVAWRWFTASAPKRAAPWGPRWLARLAALGMTKLLSVIGHVPVTSWMGPPENSGFDSKKQHMVVWHPHGAYTTMAFLHCAIDSIDAKPLSWYCCVAPVLFQLPGLRELLQLCNGRSVSAEVVDKLLTAGLTVGIQPGGIPEQLESDHTREIAVFPPRLGFVRAAMRHGVPLLPAYIFGENQAYGTSAWGRAFTKRIYGLIGFPAVPVTGQWGLPWLVPKAGPYVHVRWGAPVPVGPPNAKPSDAEVEAVFAAYVTELRRVFDAHKGTCLPPEVADKGLLVVKRGSKL